MANYNYDETGNMSAFFLITLLVLVLTPLTISSLSSSSASKEIIRVSTKRVGLTRDTVLL
jgi:translocation protein SEC63